jgi:hypothetical protein
MTYLDVVPVNQASNALVDSEVSTCGEFGLREPDFTFRGRPAASVMNKAYQGATAT